MVGGQGAARSDPERQDRLRARRPFAGHRNIVVLGCTGGAGQTVIALMIAHTLAELRQERVIAVDLNPGSGSLARRVPAETAETLITLLASAGRVAGYPDIRGHTSAVSPSLEVLAPDDDPATMQGLDDHDHAVLARLLGRHYKITVTDPAASGVARVLPYADQLVLVAPASADASRAVAMTYEWLDGHGHGGLRAQAVTVVNGVSKRSMGDVERAESVARGRCRAIVRVPWDDDIGADRGGLVDLDALRAQTRRSATAIAGILVAGFAALPESHHSREVSR